MPTPVFMVLADEGSGGSIIPGCLALLISLAFTIGVIYWLIKAKQPKTPPMATLLNITNGVFFGTVKNRLIGKQQNADGHVLVVGGAGSGKTSCIAIPTLRDTWSAPALVVDIKGELYEKSRRPHAAVFNSLDADTFGYNPFSLLKENPNPTLYLCTFPNSSPQAERSSKRDSAVEPAWKDC